MKLIELERAVWLGEAVRFLQPFVPPHYDILGALLRDIQTARTSTMWKTGSRTEGMVNGDFYRYFLLVHERVALPYMEIFDQVTKQGMLVGVWDVRLYDVHEHYVNSLAGTGLYKSAKERCGGDFYFPMLYRDQFTSPEDLIRNHTGKMQYTSHLLGAKSTQVNWSLIENSKLKTTDWSDLMQLANDHSDEYNAKHDMDLHQIEYDWTNYRSLGNSFLIARDLRIASTPIVAAMALLDGLHTANADCIGKLKNHSLDLKPYSLISVACLAMAVHAFMSGASAINLGLNFENTDYKDFLPITRKPLMNLPMFPYRAPRADIEQILIAEAFGRP